MFSEKPVAWNNAVILRVGVNDLLGDNSKSNIENLEKNLGLS